VFLVEEVQGPITAATVQRDKRMEREFWYHFYELRSWLDF